MFDFPRSCKPPQTQRISKLWDNFKWPTMYVIGVSEREEEGGDRKNI